MAYPRNHSQQASSTPSAVLRLFLPSTYSSWSSLPMNPLEGLPGAPATRDSSRRGEAPQKEDFQFYCDPCQKGFHTQLRYQEHLKDHIYCNVPGCKFTCRKSKQWKMELHVETLHNRPDAPQLQDVDAYLRQRRGRFPTSDAVQSKVEELFYKASRGEVLPDERRRWMRQHGVMISKKRARDESGFVSSNASKVDGTTELQSSSGAVRAERDAPTKVVFLEAPVPVKTDPLSAPHEVAPAPRKQRLVPEGPDGRLSKSQKVQLIREKYRESQVVPKFYVCNRCGEKGTHWVADCPMLHDERFERHNDWGEDHRPRPRLERPTANQDEESAVDGDATCSIAVPTELKESADAIEHALPSGGDDVTACSRHAQEELITAGGVAEHDIDAPAATDARGGDHSPEVREFVKVIQPVAAKRMRGHTSGRGVGRRQDVLTNRDHQHSLFSRLTVDEGINDKGLLLQALRFFVVRDFFNEEQ